MSRRTACRLFGLLLTGQRFSAKQLAIELGMDESNVREWFYALQAQGLAQPVGRVMRPPGSGRGLNATQLWQLTPPQPTAALPAAMKT